MRPPCDEGAISVRSDAATPCLHGGAVLVATILATGMAFIDGTVVNVALPALQNGLQASASQVQWVVESYALLLAALLLVGGSLGDLYGRRKVFVAGVLLFAAASAACGLSPTIHWLIATRALQGVGAAMLVPGSLALISSSFDDAERGRAIGTWSGWTAITAAIGPVIGGWLIQHASWRWVFFLNLPLAAVVVVVTLWRVRESRNENLHGGLDWLGAALVTVGLGGVTYALIEWQAGRGVWAAGALGVMALGGFVAVEHWSRSPMVSLTLFRSRNFSGANLLTLFLYGGLGGMFYFLPLDLIQVQDYSPTEAGAALLPFIGLMFALSRWSGGLIARFGARLPLTIGPLISAVGFALFTRLGIGGSYWTTVFPAMVVLGLGMAVSVAPLTTAVMNSVPVSEAGVASGVNNAVSRVAQLLSVALLGLVLSAVFNGWLSRGLDRAGISGELRVQLESQRGKWAGAEVGDRVAREVVDESFVAGYRTVLWVATGLSVLSAVSALVLMGDQRGSPVEEAG